MVFWRKVLLFSVVFLALSVSSHASQVVPVTKVSSGPTIDGMEGDAAWKGITPVVVRDRRLGVDVRLLAVRTDDEIFFLVRFPDDSEDRLHKPWVWDKALEVYKFGPQREDTFAFKWNMMEKEVDLSNFSDDDYTADVWYWKANRTDPAGYADDKHHILSSSPGKKSMELVSRTGKARYLLRLGDSGKAAQSNRVLTEYVGDIQDAYESQAPDGSHADVRARGAWKDGFWTVEFGRKLDTGNDDDVSFRPEKGGRYLFGISIAGLYGEDVDESKPHPYGQGRISEPLYLQFR